MTGPVPVSFFPRSRPSGPRGRRRRPLPPAPAAQRRQAAFGPALFHVLKELIALAALLGGGVVEPLLHAIFALLGSHLGPAPPAAPAAAGAAAKAARSAPARLSVVAPLGPLLSPALAHFLEALHPLFHLVNALVQVLGLVLGGHLEIAVHLFPHALAKLLPPLEHLCPLLGEGLVALLL